MNALEGPVGGEVPRSGGVQSIDRALDILEALAAADTPLGVSEVADATGLPQGTTHRLLRSLLMRGYVRHDASRKYSVGVAATRLGDAGHRSLAQGARPHLARLVALTGETANLAVLEGDDVVYVAQVPSPHRLRVFAQVGRHVPPHSTAVGKVLMAAMPPGDAGALLRRRGLPERTAHTLTSLPDVLDRLDAVRAQGWALDDGEEELGVMCVAVPVGPGGEVVAAMSVSGPTERLADAEPAEVAARMRGVAADFAAELMG